MEYLLKYKWYIGIGLGLIVFIFMLKRNTGESSSSSTVISATPTYSEDYLLNMAGLTNSFNMQASVIQGELQKQSLVNTGQLDLANVDSYTSISVAQINAESANLTALYGLQASTAMSSANVSIANAQANADIEASRYGYLSNVAASDAQKYASEQQRIAAVAQANAAKSAAKYGMTNSLIGGLVGGLSAGMAYSNGW